ncbi:MAG TPA: hypothetical protein VM580_05700, partial [Labilithrix sp.]|nr:hypothetical protein [Labilithrix sp.]
MDRFPLPPSRIIPVRAPRLANPQFVLTANTGPLGWAYAPNAVFDRNKDYAITVGELEDAIARNCRGRAGRSWRRASHAMQSFGGRPTAPSSSARPESGDQFVFWIISIAYTRGSTAAFGHDLLGLASAQAFVGGDRCLSFVG